MNLGVNISWTYKKPIVYLRHSSSHIFFSKKKSEPLIRVLLAELWIPLFINRMNIISGWTLFLK